MKKLLYSIALLASAWLTGGTAWALDFVDGYYLIGSKAQLEEWTETSGYLTSKAKLTADIGGVDFMLSSDYFKGIFDGNGHTITLNNPSRSDATKPIALFNSTQGATIRNLVLKGTITSANKNTAAISTWNGNAASTFENLVVDVEIKITGDGDASTGAIIGHNKHGATIRNCVVKPHFTGTQNNQYGLVGWLTNDGSTALNVSNTIIIASIDNDITANSFWNSGTGIDNSKVTVSNLYVVQTSKDAETPPIDNTTYTTWVDLATGKVAYDINTAAGSNVFYQTFGTDVYPVPFNIAPLNKHDVVTAYKIPVDGYYELSSVKDVEWFADMVNIVHQTDINGKLTADIDFGGTTNAHTPIGLNTTYKFNGTFDGQGHCIRNMIINTASNFQGFFGIIRGATVIRNLIIDSSCRVTGTTGVGGITGAAQTDGGSPLIIENCVNKATITATSGSASGILGVGQSSYPTIQIKNCLNTGEITGSPAAAFCAWINKGGSIMSNCVNIGEISGADMAKFEYYSQLIRYEPGSLTMTNCYDLSGFDDGGSGQQGDQGSLTTPAPLTSGELCYKLNGSSCYGVNWTQTLGTDGYPIPFNNKGKGIVNYISAARYTTQYIDTDVTIPGGVEAFAGVVTGGGDWLHLAPITGKIAGKEPVILRGSAGYYSFVPTTGASPAASNSLSGSNSDDTVISDGTNYYALSTLDGAEPIGFYLVGSGVHIPAGKAYLKVGDVSRPVKGFTFVFDDDDIEDGIKSLTPALSKGEGVIYNLAGQRIQKMQKGINIVNGRKVLY